MTFKPKHKIESDLKRAILHFDGCRVDGNELTGSVDPEAVHRRLKQCYEGFEWVFEDVLEENDDAETDADAVRVLARKHPKIDGEALFGDLDGRTDASGTTEDSTEANVSDTALAAGGIYPSTYKHTPRAVPGGSAHGIPMKGTFEGIER